MRKNSCIAMLLLLYLVFLSYCILFKGSFSYFQDCMQRILSGNIQLFRVNWIPFQNLRVTLQNWKNPWMMMNLLVNVWLFCPWGIFWGYVSKTVRKDGHIVWFRWILPIAAGASLSLCYEEIQLRTGIGTFDVDDMILNGTGTVLGYAGYDIFQKREMHLESQIRSMGRYYFTQVAGNLTSLTVWTVLYYLFSVRRPLCFWIGMVCGAGVICLLQSRKWQDDTTHWQTKASQVWDRLLCFASKLLQIWLIHGAIQKWVRNGLPGLGIACCLCSSVFLIWYGIENMKTFLKNKLKTIVKV